MRLGPNQVRRAQRLLLIYDDLTTLVGDDQTSISSWLRAQNLDLKARPIDLLRTEAGLDKLGDYVAAYRHRS